MMSMKTDAGPSAPAKSPSSKPSAQIKYLGRKILAIWRQKNLSAFSGDLAPDPKSLQSHLDLF
jgi:hypothetical protein